MPGKKIKLSPNAEEVATSRYFNNGEDWEQCTLRVASSVAAIESNRHDYTEKFHEMIYNMDFIPAGRILRNAGRTKGSMLNCFALGIGDSIEEIGKYMGDALILWSEGGGCGTNFSPLRPKGDPIMGKGGQSSGLVSFLKAADAVSHTIESGGQRRAAALAAVDVSHPEIIDFINAKLVDGEISHYNISVLINEDFLTAVEKDDKWSLKFKQKEYKTVMAREIWNLIIENMVKSAEPGLLNTTNLFKNNSYYYDSVVITNPCGEIPLENGGNCCLGSLVLPSFITGNINTNWQKLERVIKLAVRFLDNVIDVNKYSLKELDIKGHNSRRIGLGVMGLADYLLAKEIRYGSDEAMLELERLFRFIRNTAYQSSVELAVEKGAFPKFESSAYGKASFIRKLPGSLRLDIKERGIRNCTLLTVPPVGTTSLLPEVSSGVEPIMYKAFKRVDRVSERIYIHPRYKKILMEGKEIPDWFVDSTDLTPKDHFETQATIQRYIDGSISKTLNFPAGTTAEDLSKYLLEYMRDLKGATVYIDGTREGQVYNKLEKAEVLRHIKLEEDTDSLTPTDVDCSTCKTDKDNIVFCEIGNKNKPL